VAAVRQRALRGWVYTSHVEGPSGILPEPRSRSPDLDLDAPPAYSGRLELIYRHRKLIGVGEVQQLTEGSSSFSSKMRLYPIQVPDL
jgi:hypothetical protein